MCNYSIFLHFESQGKYFSLLNKKKKKYSKGHCCPLIQRSQQEKELQQRVSATSSRQIPKGILKLVSLLLQQVSLSSHAQHGMGFSEFELWKAI